MNHQTRLFLWEVQEESCDLPAEEGLPTRTVDSSVVADVLQLQYEAAISRRSSYRGNLRDHLLSGNAEVWWHRRSAVAGVKMEGVFLLSHFCPATLREGVALVKTLARNRHPVVAAVPETLATQLEKAGWVRHGNVPQWFDGQLVVKVVMANAGTSESQLVRLACAMAA